MTPRGASRRTADADGQRSRSSSRARRVYGLGIAFGLLLLGLPGVAQASVGSLGFQGCLSEPAAGGCASGTGLRGQHGLVVSPDGANVYAVGKASGAGQVAELQRDPTTGDISELGCVSEGGADGCVSGFGLTGAAGIAISPDGSSVYVASATSNAVVSFQRDASTGALTETGCIAETATDGCTAAAGFSGATGITVSPGGKNVYVTSEGSNAIVVLTRDTGTGLLTWRGCLAESGAEGCAQTTGLSHSENVIVSADGLQVYETAFNGNSVVEFTRDTSTGDLTFADCLAEAGADGCRSGNGLSGADGIALSPDGSALYVAAEGSNAVDTFARSPSGGLTEQACTAETAGDTCTATPGLNGAARVAVSPDGQSVYVAGYRGNTLTTFSRPDQGPLVAQPPCLGQSGNHDGCTVVSGLAAPAGLAVSPDGNNVYTGAATSNAVDSFVRQQPTPPPTGPSESPPTSMDALGDSFTQALFSGGSCSSTVVCPANSWSTGTTPSVNSHYERLLALAPGLAGHAHNRSVSGRMMSYLDTEVQASGPDNPGYVTIMMGLNDVCGGTLTVNTMTSPTTLRAQFQTAMNDLASRFPNAKVFVASIPNPYHLWQILHTNTAATNAWNAQTVCPTMLANPTSMSSADVQRRDTVRQRVVDDNTQLQQVCAGFSQCRFDGNAVYNWQFAPYDVNTHDYFHPSLQGQADLATVTYANGFNFTVAPAAPTVTTGQATGISTSGATLNGTVNPNGADTTYHFEYGTTSSYGTPTPDVGAGADHSVHNESAPITGLSPGTLYHFRLVATNSQGPTYGTDQVFTTSGSQGAYASVVLADGPISYWRFDETSGTTAADQTGVNPGSYVGGSTLGVPGAISGDSAASFDGSSGYVSVPDSASLHTADTFSLEAWVKLTKLGAVEGIFGKGTYMLLLTSANKLQLYQNGHGAVTTATTAIGDTSNWHHVVATKSGSSVHLYLDGADVTGTVTNRTIASSTSPLTIGAGASYFNGGIDEPAVYNTALSAAQVSNHFAAASGSSSSAPVVTTTPPSQITSTGATVNGTVNPESQDTKYHFNYGTTSSYGKQAPLPDGDAGSGSTPANVSAPLTGLAPSTTYHYQLVASNVTGMAMSADQTFTTTTGGGGSAPVVTTTPPTQITSTGATVNGTVNPESQDTKYHFNYGTTSSYGKQAPLPDGDAGSGSTPANVSAPLTGLAPSTTYHYQLVATNATGTTMSLPDQTFATAGSSSSYPQAVQADSPVSYWRLGEQSGTTAADVQGTNPGTYQGGYTLGAPGAIAGDSDTAVSFDGTRGYVSVPYSASLNPAPTWSVEAWVKPGSFSTTDGMSAVNSRTPTSKGRHGYDLGLEQSNGQPYIEIGTGGAYTTVGGPSPVPLNTWTYLVATYDGANVRLYENAALVAGPTKVTYSPNTITPLNLGSIGDGLGQFFPGGIDEAAVYNTALSAMAIQNHYSAGTSG